MRYAINRDLVSWRVLDGEAVLLNLETSHYYSLNATGTVVWEALAEGPRDREELTGLLAGRFEVGEPEARRDIEQLLGVLLDEQLVLPADGP